MRSLPTTPQGRPAAAQLLVAVLAPTATWIRPSTELTLARASTILRARVTHSVRRATIEPLETR